MDSTETVQAVRDAMESIGVGRVLAEMSAMCLAHSLIEPDLALREKWVVARSVLETAFREFNERVPDELDEDGRKTWV